MKRGKWITERSLEKHDPLPLLCGVGVKSTYRNPWYDSSKGHDPEYYVTEAEPREYRGYFIYNRIPGVPGRGCWDIVKDGVCVAQRAGDTNHGLNQVIDEIIGDKP